MEKYLQVKWGNNMVFRDSLQFLPAFLEQLTASLAKTGRENFYNLHEVVAQIYPESNIKLPERNSVFCYDYVDSFSQLDELALPSREVFLTISETLSVQRPTTPTPSTYSRTFSVRASKTICGSTSSVISAYWPMYSKCFETTR